MWLLILFSYVFFQAVDIAHPRKCISSSISLFVSLLSFNFCLGVVLLLDKGGYPENLHVVFCPNK